MSLTLLTSRMNINSNVDLPGVKCIVMVQIENMLQTVMVSETGLLEDHGIGVCYPPQPRMLWEVGSG